MPPTDHLALRERAERFRAYAATSTDLDELRITAHDEHPAYRCDCRCHCHMGSACGLSIEGDTTDCTRSCRASHILASGCDLDARRTDG